MEFQEDFIHYIWKFRKFRETDLSVNSEKLKILSLGFYDGQSGPDFKNASIKIGNIKLDGNIEIDKKSSDWYKHNHHKNKSFNSVILHLVWEKDISICKREDSTILPTLELKNIVDDKHLYIYINFFKNQVNFPCKNSISQIPKVEKISMVEKAFFKKIQSKNSFIFTLLKENKNDWEETIYQSLSYNFGLLKNKDNFLKLSKSIPYKIIKKHSDSLIEIESLFFGQANLIPEKTPQENIYISEIRKIYNFFKYKYKLQKINKYELIWNFYRVRPSNFPTIKIAQFAKVLYTNISITSLISTQNLNNLYKKLKIVQSSYWRQHYRFGILNKNKISGVGKQWINNIVINFIVPISIAYAKFKKNDNVIPQILNILYELPPEENSITKKWNKININMDNAFDSQGHIALYNEFCKFKKCLYCSIGCKILNQKDKLIHIFQGELEKKFSQ